MSVETNKAIVRRYLEGGTIDEFYAPDCVVHGGNGEFVGRDAFKQQSAESFFRTFATIRFTIDDLIAEGDKVVVRYTWQATHLGEWRGLAPTNKQFSAHGIVIFRVADGKIAEEWDVKEDLMYQLGTLSTAPG